MYRLIAAPFILSSDSQHKYQPYSYSVAIIGYRTYPDSVTVNEQVSDIRVALNVLIDKYSHLYDNKNITFIGHSSGAHIALLTVVDYIKEQLDALQQRFENEGLKQISPSTLPFDSFCGISGPYDISHHFEYEANRGVEELSPMKPVNGYILQEFQSNSPMLRLRQGLMYLYPNVEATLTRLCPFIALIHGIEDDTVPFTATSEAGHKLRSLGITNVQEIYIPYTGHQDAIVQCMLGGRTWNAVMEWITSLAKIPSSVTTQRTKIIKLQSKL